ncbi:MAG TPA: alpha-1,2-fucosyltransferase [Patescibacteria group bacterium]|nr:alpha-1,2-fucosyltransferase [Patescibacteria group bacterium]
MIFAQFQGGLGNQLFQYALGASLAKLNKTNLQAEVSYYFIVKNRQFVLDKLGLHIDQPPLFSHPLLTPLHVPRIQKDWLKLLDATHMYGLRYVCEEKQFFFDKNIFSQRGNLLLSGFWQHLKYIEPIQTELRSDLGRQLKKLSPHSVGIHIRRTDYVTSSAFEACSVDYYKQSIRFLTQRGIKPKFYVFSDDPIWVRQNMRLPRGTVYVSEQGLHDWEEFQILASCKHIIMANSTFSWWAAWVGGDKDRIVIMPKNWSSTNPGATFALHYTKWLLL